ncbi:MAG: CHAT domain-containing protein [Bacteroidaceae bacterium]|nr:CHAT domain-containing protein [Bacteroidaceae bacterium]
MRRFVFLLLLSLPLLPISAQEVTPEMRVLGENLIKIVNKGRQREAEKLAEKYLALCTKDSYRYGRYYAEAKHIEAYSAAARGDYATAKELMDQVLAARLDERTPREEDRIGDSYYDRATYLQEEGLDPLIDLQAAAESYFKIREFSKYAYILCVLADYYNDRGEPGDADLEAECYQKAFEHADKGTKEYLHAATYIMKAHNNKGEFDKAKKLVKQLKKTMEKIAEKEPIAYADFLLSASVAEAVTGDYSQALEYADDARSIYEDANYFSDLSYAVLLKNTADFHFHLQHYQEAISFYEKAKPLLLLAEGKGSTLLELYQQLIATYDKLNRPDMVASITEEKDKLFKNADTGTDTDANSLAKQAQNQAKIGNYAAAAELGNRALRLYQSRGESRELALMYNAQSKYYTYLRQYQLADSLNMLSRSLSHKKGYSEEEALALHQKAKLLERNRNYDEADEACKQALLLLHKSGLSTSTAYASILCDRGLYQYRLDSLKAAISLTREALDLKTQILGMEHGENVMPLYHLAAYYSQLEQMDSVAYYYHSAVKLQTELVRNYFSFQNTTERELFWQRQSYLYQAASSLTTHPEKVPAQLLTDIYDAQLFTKGILLNSEIDFRQLLLKSGDKEIQDKYELLRDKHKELQRCYETESNSDDSKNRIKDLKLDIEKLERDVVYKCKEYGDFTQNLKLTSDSVRRAMQPGEAAIEFLEAKGIVHNGQPDCRYLALVLRPEWDAPHACNLFWSSDIEKLGYPAGTSITQLLSDPAMQNRIYNDSRLGKLVWKKELMDELAGATHIYFAPTGAFYQWGIEYMPMNENGTRISDTLNVYRLSSTKMLAQRSKTSSAFGDGEAVVYGGLGYTMTLPEMSAYPKGKPEPYDTYAEEEEEEEEEPNDMLAVAEQRSADSLAVVGMTTQDVQFGLLKGASEEAQAIERLLRKAGMSPKRYAAYGTEGSFKELSGSNVSLLHIATHGFFNPNISSTTSYKDPLSNSGLLFAGCNYYLLHRKNFPMDLDDGILYAQEIAQLNLQNLQLTVLSACQTGTGTLQEDGVFGVQRGFKKAGAHTLVMSLWSVDDSATRLMMTTFYEGLLGGLSRHEAFRQAQAAVRAEHNDPHFWAPFIMLDDI